MNVSFSPKESYFFPSVWTSRKAQWVEEIHEKGMYHHTDEVDLKSGVAIPVVYNDKVLAVLGFFSTEKRPSNQVMIDNFAEFSTGLIKAGISRVLVKQLIFQSLTDLGSNYWSW